MVVYSVCGSFDSTTTSQKFSGSSSFKLELEFNGIAAGLDFVLRAYGGIRSTGVKLCVVVLKCR